MSERRSDTKCHSLQLVKSDLYIFLRPTANIRWSALGYSTHLVGETNYLIKSKLTQPPHTGNTIMTRTIS